MARRVATGGGPVKVTPTNLPKKRPARKPIPADKLIRDPNAPRPATWRRGAKKTTSPVRRRSR